MSSPSSVGQLQKSDIIGRSNISKNGSVPRKLLKLDGFLLKLLDLQLLDSNQDLS